MMHMIMFSLFLTTSALALDACPKCGRMQVPYPLSTSDTCGDPRYRIYCRNNVLEFSSDEGFYYKILSINPRSNKLVVSPPLIQESTCFSPDLSLGGFELNEKSPFNISTHNTVMLFNCSDKILLSPLNCSSSSFCRKFEDADPAASRCRGTLCCHYLKDSSMTSHRIRVRYGGCSAYTSVVDMNQDAPVDAWKFGIELQWLAPTPN